MINIGYGKYISVLGTQIQQDSPDFQYLLADFIMFMKDELENQLKPSAAINPRAVYHAGGSHFIFTFQIAMDKRDLDVLKLKDPDRANTLRQYRNLFEDSVACSHYPKVWDHSE